MSPRHHQSTSRGGIRVLLSRRERREREGEGEGERGREEGEKFTVNDIEVDENLDEMEEEEREEGTFDVLEYEEEVEGRERAELFLLNLRSVVIAQAAVRRFLAMEKVSELRKRLRHCQNVVNEIVQTEGKMKERMRDPENGEIEHVW